MKKDFFLRCLATASLFLAGLVASLPPRFAVVSDAHADLVDYTVAAAFSEPYATGGNTTFHGSFTWDTGTQTVSNLQGTMNSSMFSSVENISLGGLSGLTTQTTSGSSVVATAYKNNSAAIFLAPGAGQTQVGAFTFTTSGTIKDVSTTDGSQNASFTFAFDPTNPALSNVSFITYADCTANGLMGTVCMTGHKGSPTYPAAGTMGATPLSLTITRSNSPPPTPTPTPGPEVTPTPAPTATPTPNPSPGCIGNSNKETPPLLDSIASPWDVEVNKTLTILVTALDCEDNELRIQHSRLKGASIPAQGFDPESQKWTAHFSFTPTLDQVDRVFKVTFRAVDQEKKEGHPKKYSKPWSIKIRVWGAGANAGNDSVKQVIIQRARWAAKKSRLVVAGTLKFNKMLTSAERRALVENKLVTILDGKGQSVIATTRAKGSGNWSATVALPEAQAPCQVVSEFDSHLAHREVKLAPPNCVNP